MTPDEDEDRVAGRAADAPPRVRRPFRLGLTGTFGSGKSTVAAIFAEAGVPVIDADELAREAVAPGSAALAEIAAAFGPQVVASDGSLNRRALAERVFADRKAMARLNAILHPRVREARERRIEALGDRPLVVLEIPLLFEAGRRGDVDRVVAVIVSERERFARLRRRGWTEREIVARLGMQWPQSVKAALADDVIDNSGDVASTRAQTLDLLQRLQGAIDNP